MGSGMQHGHELTGWLATVNFGANLGIVFGYVLVPFTVLRYLSLTRSVAISGTFFFLTCALTHLSMAFGFTNSPLMVFNHVVQVISVLFFVLGFFRLLREADSRIGRDVLPPKDIIDERP